MALQTDFSDMKKTFVSYPVFNYKRLKCVRIFWDTLVCVYSYKNVIKHCIFKHLEVAMFSVSMILGINLLNINLYQHPTIRKIDFHCLPN